MSANSEHDQPVVIQPHSRKVSIVTDPSDNRYDNFGYEPGIRRKASQQSDHSDHHSARTPPTKRSILVNGNQTNAHGDNDSVFSHHSHGIHDLHSKSRLSSMHQDQHNKTENLQQSWIYTFCMRCRGQDNTPSWEPPHWQKFCPFPLCPSYRQFSRLISIIVIGFIVWFIAMCIIGPSAAPGGRLFGLVVLTVAADFGGFLMSLTTLPRLIGMLITGIMFQNLGWVDISEDLIAVTAELRRIALVIILIRAGLEMDPEAFKKVYLSILKLGLVPWTVEFVIMAVLSHYFFGLPWLWAWCLGSIFAAVSPAVIVPCLFRLRTKGYGVAKGIPTLIVSISGIDDAASVAVFGILSSILFSTGSLSYQISQAPVCILGGLGFGVLWGYISRFVPEKGDTYVVPIRTIFLFAGGMLAIFGSDKIGFEGAGPLAVVFAAFVSNYYWCKQGWEIEDNPVSTAFEIFWMFFEPALFGITGAAVKINELEPGVVCTGAGILIAAVVIRIIATIAIAFGDGLNLKEKIFVAFACMAKATVQAALGPVTLRKLGPHASQELKNYAEIILMVCILSIVITAPVGAIIISLSGPRLLTKTKPLTPQQEGGWRLSHRPSLYDISIIDEQEERDDPEAREDPIGNDGKSGENGTSTETRPVFTITK